MDSDRVFRNHFSVILDSLLTIAIVTVVVLLMLMEGQDPLYSLIIIACVMSFALLALVHWWHNTTYTFTDTGVEIDIDTLFKSHNSIPYAKLASVGVRRTLTNHIFGTSTLTFNVNSSLNASLPEGTLCLKKPAADQLRDALNAMIFSKDITLSEDLQLSTMIHISDTDILIHSFFGQSTWQQIFGTLMLVYSVYGVFAQNAGGVLIGFMMFLVSEGIPMVKIILKYYNYRIYRVGDTVTVESGLITNYRSSFKVNKVNSVKIYQPFLARLCGRASLVGEVVGLAGEDGIPLLCPTKRTAEVRDLMSRLLPEFACGEAGIGQPRNALYPMMVLNGLLSAAIAAAAVYVCSLLGPDADPIAVGSVAAVALVAVSIIMGQVFLAQNHRQLSLGDGICMVLHGSYDLEEEYINLDKVQYTSVDAGPIQRRFGLARCTIHMMTAIGTDVVKSGLFLPEDLEKIGGRVMSRIEDGSYDYRDYY